MPGGSSSTTAGCMSTNEPITAGTPQLTAESLPTSVSTGRQRSIVPADTIAGRALIAVIGIMTFLAALTIGAVIVVRDAAGEWQAAVSQELTIQVLPVEGRDVEADVKKAAESAAAAPGVRAVRIYSKEQSAELIAPWLANGLSLAELPVPRLIAVRIAAPELDEHEALRAALRTVPGVRLDDHRGWIERMRVMGRGAMVVGMAVLALVITATVLSVAFATRGAMASNRPTIEVLHLVGAKEGFIASQFQWHFLLLGLKGGAVGGVAAMALFAAARLFGEPYMRLADGIGVAALVPRVAIGPAGYAGIIGLVILIAVVTAASSRVTVRRTLGALG